MITQGGSVYNCLLDYKRTEVRVRLIACGEFSAFAALKPICQFFLKYTHTYTALGPFAAWLMWLFSCKANTCCTCLVSSCQAPLVLPELYLVLSDKLLWWLGKFDDISFFFWIPDLLSDNRVRSVGLRQLFHINALSSNKVSGWLSTRDLWNALMLPHFKSLHKQPGNELNKFCWRRKKKKKALYPLQKK